MKRFVTLLFGLLVLSLAFADELTPSEANKEQILQLALDHPSFELYLHPEVAGRLPVYILGSELPHNLNLSKFGMPVKIVSVVKPHSPVVRIKHFDVHADTADLQLEYSIEGIVGNFSFNYRDGRWKLVKANVLEN